MSQTVLITGASGGIGYELACLFARNGHTPVLVARSETALRQLAQKLVQEYGVTPYVSVRDLTDPAAPGLLYEELQQAGYKVDILVNNAGFAEYGMFNEIDTRPQLDMIQVNVAALVHLTRLFLPHMVERGSGRVLNVASIAAFQPGPLMAVYYATKAFVLSFSEALANELKGSGVTVTALCPGPTATGFEARAKLGTSKLFKGGIAVMDAAAVARCGYEGLWKGTTLVIPGFSNRVLVNLVRFFPRKMVAAIARMAQEKA